MSDREIEIEELEAARKANQEKIVQETLANMEQAGQAPDLNALRAAIIRDAEEISCIGYHELKSLLVPGEPGYGTREFELVAMILGLKKDIDELRSYILHLEIQNGLKCEGYDAFKKRYFSQPWTKKVEPCDDGCQICDKDECPDCEDYEKRLEAQEKE